MRGRKRLTTAEKMRRGTAQKNPQRINKREPVAPTDGPTKPAHLDDLASAKWDHVVELFREMDMLSRADGDLIELYCVAYSGYRAALASVAKTGQVLVSRKPDDTVEVKRNPFSVELHKYAALVAKLLSEMGLTPSSRSRVHANNASEPDPLFEILWGSMN